MPVRGRIDMLVTGMRSPLRDVRGTRSVFAERINDGRYIDIEWDRGELRAPAYRWRRPRRQCKTQSAATTSPPSFRAGRATR
jgi:hypothetical protein